MATEAQIRALRVLINDTTEPYDLSDEDLSELIDLYPNPDQAASIVWSNKAGQYSTLVNVSESGSSRNMGDMYKNALAMAKFYRDKFSEETAPVNNDAPFVVDIVRD